MCVIDLAQKKDASSKFPGQDVYVPWLVCMDSSKDSTAKCHKQVGIDPSDVQSCLKSDVSGLLKQYMQVDKPIKGTPTVNVNGKNVNSSFKSIKKAICKADSSLSGCSKPSPSTLDQEVAISEVPRDIVV